MFLCATPYLGSGKMSPLISFGCGGLSSFFIRVKDPKAAEFREIYLQCHNTLSNTTDPLVHEQLSPRGGDSVERNLGKITTVRAMLRAVNARIPFSYRLFPRPPSLNRKFPMSALAQLCESPNLGQLFSNLQELKKHAEDSSIRDKFGFKARDKSPFLYSRFLEMTLP